MVLKMRSREYFYELKNSALKELDNSFYLPKDNIESYLNNYRRLYLLCNLLDDDKREYHQKKILENVYVLIEYHKNKYNDLENEINSSIITDTLNIKPYLIDLKNKYPLFESVIIVDDI